MTDRFERLTRQIREQVDLQTITLASDLAEAQSEERKVRIQSYNWSSKKFDKITVMHTSVAVPPMDQLNSIFYPSPCYDLPIFLFLTVVTKSHVIAIYNANCPLSDDESKARYVDPLMPIYKKYAPFDGKERYPDWFEKYRNPTTIFGLYPMDQLETLVSCALEYLHTYLQIAREAPRVEDPERLAHIDKFHEQFREDIRTKDRGRWVLAKLMSDEYARRIFYEVAT